MNYKAKRILTLFLTLLLAITSIGVFVNPKEVKADGGYELRKSVKIEDLFAEPETIPTRSVRYMTVVAPNGSVQEVFCVDKMTPAREGSTYSEADMDNTWHFGFEVLYAWQLNHIGAMGSATAAEYTAVQAAIWGRQSNFDPINMTILPGLSAEKHALAESIRSLASALYNESFNAPSATAPIGTHMVYRDVNGNWQNFADGSMIDFSDSTAIYSFPNSSNPDQKYYRSPLMAAVPNKSQLAADFGYEVSLEAPPGTSLPDGILITDSSMNVNDYFGSTRAYFNADSAQGTAFYVFVPVEAGNQTPIFRINVNTHLKRFSARLWVSEIAGSQTLMSRFMVNEGDDHEQYVKLAMNDEPMPPDLDETTIYLGRIMVKKTGNLISGFTQSETDYGTLNRLTVLENQPLKGVEFSVKYDRTTRIGNVDIPAGTFATTNQKTDENGEIVFIFPVAVPEVQPADTERQSRTETHVTITEEKALDGYNTVENQQAMVTTFYCNTKMAETGVNIGDPYPYCVPEGSAIGGNIQNLGLIVYAIRRSEAAAIGNEYFYNRGVVALNEAENDLNFISFSIPKVDENGEPLEGAVYGLYTGEAYQINDTTTLPMGSLVALLTSDANGVMELNEQLPTTIKSYTLKELDAPDGYLIDGTVYKVDIEGNNAIVSNDDGKIMDKLSDSKDVPPPVVDITLQTLATADGEKTFTKGQSTAMKDVVAYTGLTVGEEYELVTTLMDADTAQPVEGVEHSSTFTPEETNGTHTVEFTLDTSNFAFDHSYVFFEELKHNGVTVKRHAELDDVNQTIKTDVEPTIEPVVFSADLTKVLSGDDAPALVDGMFKFNLSVEGEGIEILSGESLSKANGNLQTPFSVKINNEGQFRLIVTEDNTYRLPGVDYTGISFRTVATQARIYVIKNGNELIVSGVEEGVFDFGNYVNEYRKPSMGTTATVNGEKTFVRSENTVLTDVVVIKNVDKNKQYVLKTDVYNKRLGQIIEAAHVEKPLESVADTTTVTINIGMNTLDYEKGDEFVFFEELWEVDGEKVLEHKDVNDADQTVTIDEPTPEEPPLEKKVNQAYHDDLDIKNETFVYDLTTKIPANASEFMLTDVLEPVLQFATVNDKAITVSIGDYTLTDEELGQQVSMSDQTLIVNFTAQQLEDYADEDVKVTFGAKIRDEITIDQIKEVYGTEKKVPNYFEYKINNEFTKKSNTVTITPPDDPTPEPDPTISTTATVGGEKTFDVSDVTVTINDEIVWSNIDKSIYIVGELWDKANNKIFQNDDTDVIVRSDNMSGSLNRYVMNFEINTTGLQEGNQLVVKEFIYDAETNELIIAHDDLNSAEQTVTVTDDVVPPTPVTPTITTTATVNDSKKFKISDETVTIKDVVVWTNIIDEQIYIKGELWNKTTNQPFKNGDQAVVVVSETMSSNLGTYVMNFTINTDNLNDGDQLVVKEFIYRTNDDELIIAHDDLNSAAQTVTAEGDEIPEKNPKIRTSASVNGQKTFDIGETLEFTDVVTYEELNEGQDYVLITELMDKANKVAIAGTRKETPFKPAQADGTETIKISVDTSKLAEDSEYVFFEVLTDKDGNVIVEHKKYDDAAQTVKSNKSTPKDPKIQTLATVEGEKTFKPEGVVIVKDVISYQDFEADTDYVAEANLMISQTESIATATKPFKTEGENGTVDVFLEFDASNLGINKKLVVYEVVKDKAGNIVAEHRVFNDASQTVTTVGDPALSTTATVNDEKRFTPRGVVTIVDKVQWTNMENGDYVLEGVLWDKTNEKFLSQNNKEVRVSQPLKIETKNGSATMTFEIDGSLIEGGTEIVVFEYIKKGEEVIIKHEDPNDVNQTVTTKINVNLEIQKVDGNKLLEGAEFTLYRASDTEKKHPVKSGTTGEDGTIRFVDLEQDKYILEETKAPRGYVKLLEDIEVDLSEKEEGSLTELKVENKEAEHLIRIIKTDAANSSKFLKGAEFGLYEEGSKDPIIRGITDENGVVEFTHVKFGKTYTIKELIAPDGYEINEKVYTVTIDKKDVKVYEVNVTNKHFTSVIVIKKVNQQKEPLKGVKFGLYLRSDTKLQNRLGSVVTTNDEGIIKFTNVPQGEYVLVEVETLPGYQKLDKNIDISVKDIKKANEEITVTVINSKTNEEQPDNPVDVDNPTDKPVPYRPVITGDTEVRQGGITVIHVIGLFASIIALAGIYYLKKKENR